MKSFFPFWRLQRFNVLRPRLTELVRKEWTSTLSKHLSLPDKLDCWRNGFLSESHLIYDFDKHSKSDYLTDYARFTKAGMNGIYTSLLNNKVMFDAVMRPFQPNIPRSYAVLINKKFQSLVQDPKMRSPQDLVDWCMAGNNIVLKPLDGGGGSGIIVITADESEMYCNGVRTSADELARTIERLDRYLIQEKIEQADYARAIYPRATNTIRALTMWDPDTDEPFIAMAVHRFGCDKSYPVDNWTQGGFCAAVNLATGEMSQAVTYPNSGKLAWRKDHPTTGEPIAGVCIPNWSAVSQQLLHIARAFPYWRYVGWDIMLDRNSTLRIIEGNHRSDVNLLQVHAPLLRDPRVRKFYQQNQ